MIISAEDGVNTVSGRSLEAAVKPVRIKAEHIT